MQFLNWYRRQKLSGQIVIGIGILFGLCCFCGAIGNLVSPDDEVADTPATDAPAEVAAEPTATPLPPTDRPTPESTNTPMPELSFSDIIQHPDEKGWTSTQYSTYLDTIESQRISGWSGTILEIDESFGNKYISIDIEPGEPQIDAYVYISDEDVLRVGLGQNVTFAGIIESYWSEPDGFYSLQIKEAELLELGEIPPTPTPEPTMTPIPPTETPEPTATTQPTQTQDQNTPVIPLVTANDGDVNLRSGPSTDYEVAGSLAAGDSLEIIGRNADSSWWQVQTPSGPAWVAASVTAASDVSDAIQIVEAPPAPVAAEEPAVSNFQEGQVTEVVDGDTIKVLIDGQEFSVRYILVDTPEPNEPNGPEATLANEALVGGQLVRLEKDVSEVDQFGRLLRYVYIGDLMVNEELLRQGMARVATFPPDVKYVDRFQVVQAEAQAAGVGLWAEPGVEEPAPSGGSLVIVNLDKREEYAEIRNESGAAIDLTGWRLFSERGAQDCPLGGVIEPGQTLQIWAMAEDADRGGYNCGFGTNIWNNSKSDPAVLYDPSGAEVSRR